MKSKISVSKNLNELKKRAKQRAATLSMNPKNESETTVEKDFFKVVESQIYTQIARN